MMLINTFKGCIPRKPQHRLGLGEAVVAHDVNLTNGTLQAWRETKVLTQMADSSMTLAMHGCCFFAWDKCVSVAPWKPDCPRFYITGRMPYPEVAVITPETCSLEYARLGVKTPDTTPVVSYISASDIDKTSEYRDYIFTYVNWLGEESGPSYPSTEILVKDGATVTVAGWEAQADEYKITTVRIYRKTTGFRTGAEKEQEPLTGYLLVDQIAITQNTYIDVRLNRSLSYALSTREVKEPPVGLREIILIEGTNILAGVVGNKIYLSLNGEPWNWPIAQELTLDDNIVHLGQDENILYATTTGKPYYIEDILNCEERPCRPVTKADYPYPDIGCGYAHTAIGTPMGMLFASVDGLVLFNRTTAPILITEQILSAEDWKKVKPDTIRLAYYQGCIICITDVVSFILLVDRSQYAVSAQYVTMTTISDKPIDLFINKSGELIMMNAGGKVVQWNAGTTLRSYEWSTNIIVDSTHWWPAARLGIDGKSTVTVKTEHGVEFNRIVTQEKPFRLPRLGRSRSHTITVRGTGSVTYMRIGETLADEANRN